MEIEIKSKKENVLLDRTDVQFVLKHPGEKTPTRDQIKKALTDALGSKPDVTVVESVHTEFGRGTSAGTAKVYKTVDKARAVEPVFLQKRNAIYVEPKKREERAPAAKAEKPKKAGKREG